MSYTPTITVSTPTPYQVDTIRGWWEQRRQYAPPPQILSPWAALASHNTATSGESVPLAAAFLYPCTSTPVAHIHWLVTDPGSHPALRASGLRAVMAHLESMAIDLGHPFLFTATDNEQLAHLGERSGYTIASPHPFIPLFKFINPRTPPLL